MSQPERRSVFINEEPVLGMCNQNIFFSLPGSALSLGRTIVGNTALLTLNIDLAYAGIIDVKTRSIRIYPLELDGNVSRTTPIGTASAIAEMCAIL
jgi:hypothetical protein